MRIMSGYGQQIRAVPVGMRARSFPKPVKRHGVRDDHRFLGALTVEADRVPPHEIGDDDHLSCSGEGPPMTKTEPRPLSRREILGKMTVLEVVNYDSRLSQPLRDDWRQIVLRK